jgi:hypothetical protein
MKILIACEMSGVVRRAFRARGHEAYSCDLLPSLDNSPFHYAGDVLPWLGYGWDMLIAFPPCDRLLGAGARYWKKWQASGEQQKAIEFFMRFVNAPVPRIGIENPVGIMSSIWLKPDGTVKDGWTGQIVNPWMFGHMEQKKTCIWRKGLPELVATNNVYAEMMKLPRRERERVHFESPGKKNGLTRSQRRALTFEGLAEGMAEQWGRNV